MAIPVNPYVAGNPVGDSPAFVGRADVLREVLRTLRRPQDNAIVLYGQRRIGKTSILQHLAAWLSRKGPYRLVYFDLQDKAAWPLGRVLQDLARMVAGTLGQPDPDLGSDPETAFRQEWLPAVLDSLPDGYSLVLLFDEFDVLADSKAEQAAAAFFPYLRGLLTSDPRRLQFIFVIGRNVGDLDNIALSLFKGTSTQRVSLLNREDTTELVRLSEANHTLRWPDEAVERVWQLTCGHPFLTQALCFRVWERTYDEERDKPLTVTLAAVDAAVPGALEASRNALEWLWGGLPPAERVVASALAEAGPGSIAQERLERLLHESGVRVVIRELQSAPQLLQDWDLIEPTDSGYRFRVELLRRWIAEHKPLRRVQEELDRIEPVAENLYRAALGLYQGGQLEQTVALLRQAVVLNPNHVRANQLLADILLVQGQPGEARQLLERLYEYQPAAARPRLVQALLAQAQIAEGDDERLVIYERVSELDSTQPEATAGRRNIWQRRGDAALVDDDLETALHAYREAGLADQVAEVEQEMRRRALATRLQELEALEKARRYQDALNLARQLADEYADVRNWSPDLERLERQVRLADLYQRGLGALQSGDRQAAQVLLAQVVALEPGYEDATRYLHLAVTGMDIADLQAKLAVVGEVHSQREQKLPPAGVGSETEAGGGEREQELQPFDIPPKTDLQARERVKTTTKGKGLWDHLRLLWEKLAQSLGAYLETLARTAEHRAGDWLVSTLTWLPLFISTVALGLVPLPRMESILPPAVYLRMSLGLILAWVLTAWLGKGDNRVAVRVMTFVGFIMAFSIAATVLGGWAVGLTRDVIASAALVVAVGVAFTIAGGAARCVARAVAGSVATAVAAAVAVAMAGIVVIITAAILAFVMAGAVVDSVALAVTDSMPGNVICIVAGAVAFGVVFALAFGLVARVVGGVVAGAAENAGVAFVVLLLTCVFLFWISFLDGCRVFQQIWIVARWFKSLR